MDTRSDYIAALLQKYLLQTLTDKEQSDLDQWINESPRNKNLFNDLTNPAILRDKLNDYNRVPPSVHLPAKKPDVIRVKPGWKYAAAAIFITALLGSWWYISKPGKELPHVITYNMPLPNNTTQRVKVLLKLPQKPYIYINALAGGTLLEHPNWQIVKQQDTLKITSKGRPQELQPVYTTIRTGNKQTYPVLLPDGTEVFLNSGSSISFPVMFKDDVREVTMSGEASFNVVARKNITNNVNKVPFIVNVKTPEGRSFMAEVTGTQFNVNAYGDLDKITTTVLSGSVILKRNGIPDQEIDSGQTAQWTYEGKTEVHVNDDVQAATAWKNNEMIFHDTPIQEVIPRLERSYDTTILYNIDSLRKKTYTGEISAAHSLNDVLALIAHYCGGSFTVAPTNHSTTTPQAASGTATR
jgi:ferric-dicitrate binding protein FerR (iron transport regulator)